MPYVDNITRRYRLPTHVIALFILVLTTFPVCGNAQFGIKAGTTVSSFYYSGKPPSPYEDYDVDLRPWLGYDVELVQTEAQKPLFSAYVSIYRSFSLTPRIVLRPELSFTQKGVNLSQFDYEEITYKVRISYLEIPLSVAFSIIQKQHTSGNLYIGGYGALKINAVKKVEFHHSPLAKTKITAVKRTEAGLHLGLNYQFRLNDKPLLADLRVFMGLTNIFELPANWTKLYFDSPETRTSGINLSLGYEF